MTWKEFNCMWSLSLPYCWLYRVKTYRSLGKDFSTKQNMWMECQECQTKTPFFRVCFFKRKNNWFFLFVCLVFSLLLETEICCCSSLPADICPHFYLSCVPIFSIGTGSLIEVRHLSHRELRARQAVVKLPQASSKRKDPAVTESALAALQYHFLMKVNRCKAKRKKKKKPSWTKVKQSSAIQNLKYVVSR